MLAAIFTFTINKAKNQIYKTFFDGSTEMEDEIILPLAPSIFVKKTPNWWNPKW